MKYSRQRELIRETVRQSDRHPTAEAVFHKVRLREPTISLATVYRNLNQLVDNRELRRISVPGGSDHFDYTTDYHEHMICTACGALGDVWPGRELDEQLRALPGVTDYELILYGLCPDCAEK
ncbi:MAG TPA: transcriptional repressor [Clostridiales bacterium]|nr:transcriptional repressor [Clostridiales bacterium]